MAQTQKEKNQLISARRREHGITKRGYWVDVQAHLKVKKIESKCLDRLKKNKKNPILESIERREYLATPEQHLALNILLKKLELSAALTKLEGLNSEQTQ